MPWLQGRAGSRRVESAGRAGIEERQRSRLLTALTDIYASRRIETGLVAINHVNIRAAIVSILDSHGL